MEYQNEAAKFAHLQYEVLHKLQISINEYWLLDMVYQLSRSGPCFKSLQSIANDMRLTKNGVVKIRDRLIERELLKKDKKGRLSTSVLYNSVYRVNPTTYNSVQNRTTKYNAAVQLSGTKNNIEINKEKKEKIKKTVENSKDDPRGTYSPAKERLRQMVKAKDYHLFDKTTH